MHKISEKLHHHDQEKDLKESDSSHLHTSTESTSPSEHKQHNFSNSVADKFYNMFHPSKATATTEPSIIHEHASHEHIHEHINAPIVETVVRPTVVEETVRRDKVVEIQPIIHRHIEAPEVHHIEQHVYEKLPPVGPSRVVKQPVVEETIQPHITEEVRTFVHREVPAPYVVHEEQHISEHFVNPTIHTAEVREQLAQPVVHKQDNVSISEVHVDDWENQRIDNCPLAADERQTTLNTVSSIKPGGVTLEKKVVFDQKPPLQAGGGRV